MKGLKKENFLGFKVKDVVTGFIGVVESWDEWFYMSPRAEIRPINQKGENNFKDTVLIDAYQLKVISKKPIKKPNEPVCDLSKNLYGYLFKDKITGFIGVYVGKSIWLNGCVRICLQPDGQKTKNQKEFNSGIWFASNQLKRLNKGKKDIENNEVTAGPAVNSKDHILKSR